MTPDQIQDHVDFQKRELGIDAGAREGAGMSAQITYWFRVDKRPDFHCEAPNNLVAYNLANTHYGSLPQGAWTDTFGPRAYRWAEGNFFD